MNLPKEIVDGIVDDLKGRQSLGDIWERIEPDIKEEIVDEWRRIAKDKIEVMLDAVFEEGDIEPDEHGAIGEVDEG